MTDASGEEWRIIPGIPDYSVSSLGRIQRVTPGKSTRPGRILTPTMTRGGLYVRVGVVPVSLRVRASRPDGPVSVARLVAFAFSGDPNHPDAMIGYRDGDMRNVRATNVFWNKERYRARRGRAERMREWRLRKKELLSALADKVSPVRPASAGARRPRRGVQRPRR